MKILVLGASGGVGQHIVQQAAAAGHSLTVVARKPMDLPAGARLIVGEVLQPGVLDSAVQGQDAVLSALGIRRVKPDNPWSPLASPADLTSRSAELLVAAMRRHGVQRVIAVSAAGIGDSRAGLNPMMRFFIRFSNVGKNYADLERMELVYAASGLDWCCVRPTGLKDATKAFKIKQIADFPLTAFSARSEVARWMVEEVVRPAITHRTPIITEAA